MDDDPGFDDATLDNLPLANKAHCQNAVAVLRTLAAPSLIDDFRAGRCKPDAFEGFRTPVEDKVGPLTEIHWAMVLHLLLTSS